MFNTEYRSEFKVVPRGMKSISNILFLSQKTAAINFPTNFSLLNFLTFGECVCRQCFNCTPSSLVCNNRTMFHLLWSLNQEILSLPFQNWQEIFGHIGRASLCNPRWVFFGPSRQFSVLQIIRQNWVNGDSAAHSLKFFDQLIKVQPANFQHKLLDFRIVSSVCDGLSLRSSPLTFSQQKIHFTIFERFSHPCTCHHKLLLTTNFYGRNFFAYKNLMTDRN